MFQTYLSVKLADSRMSIKQEKQFFIPNLQYSQLEQDG